MKQRGFSRDEPEGKNKATVSFLTRYKKVILVFYAKSKYYLITILRAGDGSTPSRHVWIYDRLARPKNGLHYRRTSARYPPILCPRYQTILIELFMETDWFFTPCIRNCVILDIVTIEMPELCELEKTSETSTF